ncbi:acyltransferase family protein [Roseateles sp. NT4]|uniref:acyltransferase family protein n=1 Tax=Roseateles sp. NT4 TaxID=3453715 RepID=UPI003EE85A7B
MSASSLAFAADSRQKAVAGTTQINPGLQGMRGIAILLVLLNHVGMPGFGGGYVGVDVFFVISGYLIGGLLLRELTRTGRVDLWNFYARRIRRLFPAFAAVLIAVVAVVPWLYAPFEHGELMSSARASALYAANLWFASRSTNYFGGHTEANPLLHLWSLAVEEQFYLFWPLLMLLAWRLANRDARKGTARLLLIAGALSLVACVVVSRFKLQYAFFLTPMRIWEFAAGMVLFVWADIGRKLKPGAVAAVGSVSLVAIAASTLCFDEHLGFPGAWAVLPVLGTMGLLVVVQNSSANWVNRLLSSGPLTWVGDCSYSVYLWHWPLIIFATLLFPHAGAWQTVLLIALSLLLGWVSYRWIELPFKHGLWQAWSPRRIVAAGLAVCVATALTAHGIGRMDLRSDQARYLKATAWPAASDTGCLSRYDALDQPPCEFGSTTPTATLLLFGDSHAMQWFSPLQALATERGWRLITLAKVQCPALDLAVNYQGKHLEYWQCSRWRERMFERIQAIKPDLVLVASSSGYGVPPAQWQQGLAGTMQRLQGMGLKAAYLRDTPFPGFDVPTCLARASWRGQSPDSSCTYLRADEEARSSGVAGAESQALKERGVPFLDLSEAICPGAVCETERDGLILFLDRNHISVDFSMRLKPELEKRLAPLMPGGR